MNLSEILKNWRDYPQASVAKMISNMENPSKAMHYLAEGTALIVTEMTMAAGITYFMTHNTSLTLLSAAFILRGRSEQFNNYTTVMYDERF